MPQREGEFCLSQGKCSPFLRWSRTLPGVNHYWETVIFSTFVDFQEILLQRKPLGVHVIQFCQGGESLTVHGIIKYRV